MRSAVEVRAAAASTIDRRQRFTNSEVVYSIQSKNIIYADAVHVHVSSVLELASYL